MENQTGALTTEYRLSKSASIWGIVIVFLGAIVASSSAIVHALSETNIMAGVWIGIALSVLGTILKGLTTNCYTKSRTKVKINNGG